MDEKKNINDILKNLRKKIKPASGPLTSIDRKKLEKVSEDLKIAHEVEKIVEEKSDKDSDGKE